jgi:membrane fusion protein (multidrug efflux system)
VLRIAPTIDASTGTVKVTVSMPPAATAAQSFLPGMYAEVTLTTDSRSDVLLVPKAAVVRDEEQTYLFTLAGRREHGIHGQAGAGRDGADGPGAHRDREGAGRG